MSVSSGQDVRPAPMVYFALRTFAALVLRMTNAWAIKSVERSKAERDDSVAQRNAQKPLLPRLQLWTHRRPNRQVYWRRVNVTVRCLVKMR